FPKIVSFCLISSHSPVPDPPFFSKNEGSVSRVRSNSEGVSFLLDLCNGCPASLHSKMDKYGTSRFPFYTNLAKRCTSLPWEPAKPAFFAKFRGVQDARPDVHGT